MAFLFGGGRSAESLKDHERRMRAQTRAVEREVSRAEAQDAKLGREMARAGHSGRMDVATSKARELVRLRAHKARLVHMKEHVSGLAQQLQGLQSSGKIQDALAATTRILGGLNSRYDAASVARMLVELERQSALMESKQELVDGSLDACLEAEGEQAATDEALLAVLREAGLESRLGMPQPPREEELTARLARLHA